MSEPTFVCAHHPRYPEMVGELLSSPARIARDETRGAIFLPADADRYRDLKMGGFVRRQWGLSGWQYNRGAGEPGCPLVLEVRSGVSFIHWAAGVSRDAGSGQGKLHLYCDSASVRTLNTGLTRIVEAPPVEVPLDGSETYIRGVSQFNASVDGFANLSLWGVCSGVKVNWLAVSNSLRNA